MQEHGRQRKRKHCDQEVEPGRESLERRGLAELDGSDPQSGQAEEDGAATSCKYSPEEGDSKRPRLTDLPPEIVQLMVAHLPRGGRLRFAFSCRAMRAVACPDEDVDFWRSAYVKLDQRHITDFSLEWLVANHPWGDSARLWRWMLQTRCVCLDKGQARGIGWKSTRTNGDIKRTIHGEWVSPTRLGADGWHIVDAGTHCYCGRVNGIGIQWNSNGGGSVRVGSWFQEGLWGQGVEHKEGKYLHIGAYANDRKNGFGVSVLPSHMTVSRWINEEQNGMALHFHQPASGTAYIYHCGQGTGKCDGAILWGIAMGQDGIASIKSHQGEPLITHVNGRLHLQRSTAVANPVWDALCLYANGDLLWGEWTGNPSAPRLHQVRAFVCSSRCADNRFAARAFFDCDWEIVNPKNGSEPMFLPRNHPSDCPTVRQREFLAKRVPVYREVLKPDVSAREDFIAYVQAGHIGWGVERFPVDLLTNGGVS